MKKYPFIRLLLAGLTSIIVATSCTEKIDLKLNNSEPQLVIEANVSNKPGPYTVILSKSRLYYENNAFAGISGAQIILSDNAGNIDTLTEIAAGFYQTNFIQGTIGRTYQLEVSSEGTTYRASCTMPAAVSIDSVVVREETGFNGELDKDARVYFTDPAGIENFYRIIGYKNEVPSSGANIHRDRLWDGKQRNYGVPSGGIETGDTLIANLLSIDARVYQFFNEFNESSGFAQPAAPATPNSMYTPGALGYFSAHAISADTILIP
ncbi:MAG: DUF4249 domain-containing protein [Bacteroidetes bacterium]|nr:DUF4249 domain-containing protein [Bacteroidota bacterium]MBK8658472.1 DUF4249 domain-containing protein [Bacteroidota bacterium]